MTTTETTIATPAPTVTISIKGDFDLNIDQVFPDGVPDPLTLDDVARAVESAGTPERLLSDWSLHPLDVEVDLHRYNPQTRGFDMETRRVWKGRVI